MGDILKQAEDILLIPSDVEITHLASILSSVLSRSVDFADLYLQNKVEECWSLEDGLVKDAGFSVDRGFGLRVVQQEQVGFAYADTINHSAIKNAAKAARRIVTYGQSGAVKCDESTCSANLYRAVNPISAVNDQDKIDLLLSLDTYARSLDVRVKKVFIQLTATYDVMLVLNSEHGVASDLKPLVHLGVRVIVEQNGRIEQGSSGGGGRTDFGFFTQNSKLNSDGSAFFYVAEAVRKAILNLDARAVPAGSMPVVLGPGWPAVLLHEAVGHGLEADFNRKGSSVFSGRIGQQVASPLCTIVDDATYMNARGSINVDDEGVVGQRTVLIEDGILKSYMTDRHNARLLNMPETGNGRRESYAYQPLPRMTTTMMLAGDKDPGEIVESIDKGIYAVDFSGGQVDITSGKFVFTMSEAYWVESGKIVYPVKGATLVGDGAEVLSKVSMLGNDLEFDRGVGSCGKDGQTLPVGVGQPTLKIDSMTVGGVITD